MNKQENKRRHLYRKKKYIFALAHTYYQKLKLVRALQHTCRTFACVHSLQPRYNIFLPQIIKSNAKAPTLQSMTKKEQSSSLLFKNVDNTYTSTVLSTSSSCPLHPLKKRQKNDRGHTSALAAILLNLCKTQLQHLSSRLGKRSVLNTPSMSGLFHSLHLLQKLIVGYPQQLVNPIKNADPRPNQRASPRTAKPYYCSNPPNSALMQIPIHPQSSPPLHPALVTPLPTLLQSHHTNRQWQIEEKKEKSSSLLLRQLANPYTFTVSSTPSSCPLHAITNIAAEPSHPSIKERHRPHSSMYDNIAQSIQNTIETPLISSRVTTPSLPGLDHWFYLLQKLIVGYPQQFVNHHKKES